MPKYHPSLPTLPSPRSHRVVCHTTMAPMRKAKWSFYYTNKSPPTCFPALLIWAMSKQPPPSALSMACPAQESHLYVEPLLVAYMSTQPLNKLNKVITYKWQLNSFLTTYHDPSSHSTQCKSPCRPSCGLHTWILEAPWLVGYKCIYTLPTHDGRISQIWS